MNMFLKQTKNIVTRARNEHEQNPAFWLRGLISSSMTAIPSPHNSPTDDLSITHINPEVANWSSATYYGDASGGEYTSYNEIRRVGVSVVFVSEESRTTIFGLHCNLPGQIQSVGRGELVALVMLSRQLLPVTDVIYVTDNKPLSDTFNKGPMAGRNSANCDLYKELFDTLFQKGVQLSVRWMPSHLDNPNVLPEGVSEFDVFANDQADEYARIAAQQCQVPKPVAANFVNVVELAREVQQRLATILVNFPDRVGSRSERTSHHVRIPLDDLLARTSHKLVKSGNRYACSVCLNNFSIKDASLKHWLQTTCHTDTQPPHLYKPIKCTDNTHFGNQMSHISHDTYNYRGLLYCDKCGARSGVNQIRKLARPCEAITDSGKNVLACIRKGIRPPGVAMWPT